MMRTKITSHYLPDQDRLEFGVRVGDGRGRWAVVCCDGKPARFATVAEAESERAELRKKPWPKPALQREKGWWRNVQSAHGLPS